MVTGLLVGGCGGDAVTSYFERVDAVIDTMRADSIAAAPRGATPTAAAVAEINRARRNALETLTNLSPPREVDPEHRLLTTALEDLVMAVDGFLADHEGAGTEAFAAAAAAATDLSALAAGVGAACDALDARATALGIDVDLRC